MKEILKEIIVDMINEAYSPKGDGSYDSSAFSKEEKKDIVSLFKRKRVGVAEESPTYIESEVINDGGEEEIWYSVHKEEYFKDKTKSFYRVYKWSLVDEGDGYKSDYNDEIYKGTDFKQAIKVLKKEIW